MRQRSKMKLREAIKILHKGKYSPLNIKINEGKAKFKAEAFNQYRSYDNAAYKLSMFPFLNWFLDRIGYI
jgi:hypothetical protein